MTSVHVCRGCGRTIDSDFMYCPWCGQSYVHENTLSIDDVFHQLETLQATDRNERVAHIQTQLDQLEKELDDIVLKEGIHK